MKLGVDITGTLVPRARQRAGDPARKFSTRRIFNFEPGNRPETR